MAHPLELSYNYRTPVAVSTIAALGCLAALIRGRADGWVPVALLVLVLWALFAFVIVRRARSYLMVDGEILVLRPWRAYVRVEGDQVRAVRQVMTARGPSYRLTVERPEGGTVRCLAPTAWLSGGYPALFAWLQTYAPGAELDKGSRRTLTVLRERGLVADAP
jgi:hypothetical protein